MSHELEMVDGKARMAYVGEVPWHGLGKEVPADLAPLDMMKEAGLDWKVKCVPVVAQLADDYDDDNEPIGDVTPLKGADMDALVRLEDNKILDMVGKFWLPTQNENMFKTFDPFVENGDMTMVTAGSLKDGTWCWALAKIKGHFALANGKDVIENYLLFSNPHQYSRKVEIKVTPVRVVCWNTMTYAMGKSMSDNVDTAFRQSHRREFDIDKAIAAIKTALTFSKEKLAEYETHATFLSSKRTTNESIVEYFNRVFSMNDGAGGSKTKEQVLKSASAVEAMELVDKQPGADLNPGTWWNAFNAVTYMTDHTMGRGVDTRLQSSWFGNNMVRKNKALALALDMAKVAQDA